MKNIFSAVCSRIGKYSYGLLAACILATVSVCYIPDIQAQQMYAVKKHNGLMLDIARRFYSVDVIKQYIDTIASAGGGFLHLHFSDNENYALESRLLNQSAADAKFSDGLYYNRKTGKPFLSDKQLREIVGYAREKGVELVPELGSPSHMGAVFGLLADARGADKVRALKSKTAGDELDITNPSAVRFAESLLEEAAAKFPHSKRMHIGADEFGYSAESNHEFVAYANRLAAFLAKKGLKTQMWNDGVIKQNLKKLNRSIEITYWSYDGDPQDKAAGQKRRKLRASLPDLLREGFAVWNYNSYYLYFVPKADLASSGDSSYAVRDVEQNWNLSIWDGKNGKNAAKEHEKIKGAALAVWGEHSGALSDKTVFKHTNPLLKAVLHKANVRPSE